LAAAALSPLFALYLRDAAILSSNYYLVALYCLVSCIFSVATFLAFRIEDTIPRYLSAGDALNLVKAVVTGELMISLVLFSITRLDGVPRSVPAIHALILGAALFASRTWLRFIDGRRAAGNRVQPISQERIVLVGLDDASALFMSSLEMFGPKRCQIVALLSAEPRWIGRSVQGVRVFGPPSHLETLVAEFAEHGVRVDVVVIGGNPDLVPMQQIRHACSRLNIAVSSVPSYLGRRVAEQAADWGRTGVEPAPQYRPQVEARTSRYFLIKARVEFPIAVALLFFLAPMLLVASLLAFFDVGLPIMFWQQRVGLHGREFQLYKIRTLRLAFDQRGRRVPDEQRLSWVGRFLRRTRFDELPQLLNVVVGEMSLVGPRPLLWRDQPRNSATRLTVRPGLTGWAQVNGGVLLSPEEKEELDAWYICNASFWIDLRIAVRTLLCPFRGDRKSPRAFALARQDQAKPASLPAADAHTGVLVNLRNERPRLAVRGR